MILSFLFALTAKSFPLPDERRMLETCPVPQGEGSLREVETDPIGTLTLPT